MQEYRSFCIRCPIDKSYGFTFSCEEKYRKGKEMRALVFLGPGQIEYREEPDPVPRAGEILVRVAATGICGSDMHGWHGVDARRKPPLIMGHETAGWIAAGPRQGERVVINPLISCGRCFLCLSGNPQLCASKQNLALPPLPGAFADLVRIPESNVIPLADQVSFITAAVTEPLACAYHAVQLGSRLSGRPLSSMRVLVLGAGAIGLGVALILRAHNTRSIFVCEANDMRRQTVQSEGFDNVFSLENADLSDASIDLVIDSVGAQATRTMSCRMVRDGGAIVHIGLMPGSDGVDVRRLTLGEVVFTGSYCFSPVDFIETLDLLTRDQLGSLGWVSTCPMAEGKAAFEALDSPTTRFTKIVLCNEV